MKKNLEKPIRVPPVVFRTLNAKVQPLAVVVDVGWHVVDEQSKQEWS